MYKSVLAIFLMVTLVVTSYAADLSVKQINIATLPTPSFSSKVTSDDIKNIFNKYQRLSKTYGQDDQAVNFDFLMGYQTSFEIFKLKQWLQHAADQQMDLSQFEALGIHINKAGNYIIDYRKSPYLASQFELFKLVHFSRDTQEHYLLTKGFRPEDIDLLEHYVEFTNPSAQYSEYSVEYKKYILPQLKQAVDGYQLFEDNKLKALLYKIGYQKAYIRHQVERNWSLNLLNLFDKQRQRILKQVLVELIDGSQDIFPRKSDPMESSLIKALKSGALEQNIKQYENSKNWPDKK